MDDLHISVEEEQDMSNRAEGEPDPKLQTHVPAMVHKEGKTTGMEFVCDDCNKSFGKKSNLQRHLRTSTCQKPNQHSCPSCTSSFGQKQQLVNHIRKEHQNLSNQLLVELKCTKCGKEFSQKSSLDKHTRNGACQQQKTELKCPKCQKEFQKKSNLDRHIKSGTCEKEVVGHHCTICQASFSNKRSLEKHIMKDHPAKAIVLMPSLTCETCGKTFPQKEHLDLHKEKGYCDKTDERHTCPECGKTYKYRKTMLKHMRDYHPKNAPPIKPHRLTDVEVYTCCGETFANGREYRTHKDRVHIRKPVDTTTQRMTTFICKECELQFDHKSELIKHKDEWHPPEHMSSDDDELPSRFKCPYEGCQECFQSRVELTNHKNVHREPQQIENNTPCDLCDELFESVGDVRQHQVDNHGIADHTGHHDIRSQQKVQCQQCHNWFQNESDLKIHSMDEHDPNDEPENPETIFNDLESLLDTASAKSLYTKVGIDIEDKAGEKKFKANRTRQSFKLTSKALRLCEVGLALEVMNKIIGSLLKKTIEKGGYIQIKVLCDSLDTPIVMSLAKVDYFNPLVLLNYIESVMSSKDELALDQTLTFDVIHVEDMKGSGYRLNTMMMESFMKRQPGIFDPRNLDNRCLGLSLAAWELIERLRSEGEDLRKAAFFKEPNKCHELKTMASRMYAEAGVDEEKECGEEELRRFQHLFNMRHRKQLVVLDKENCVTFKGEPAIDRLSDQVFLLWYGKHYSLIWDIEQYLGRRNKFCPHCKRIYNANTRHLCEGTCQQCERVNCEALVNHETIIECERCNITFKHTNCYLAHSNETQRVCTKRYRCPVCLTIRYTGQKHDCNKKPRCAHCNEEVDPAVHLCKVQVPTEKALLGGSNKFNVIYFDVETGKDEDGKLVPYTICYAINCEKCIDLKTENCSQCGPRYRHHYGWNSAFDFCDWLTSNRRIEKHRTILTAHNSAKFDAYFIYEYAALAGSKPNLQFRANDLLSFKWKKVQLKDSYQFMKSSLDKLPSILGLSGVQKGLQIS